MKVKKNPQQEEEKSLDGWLVLLVFCGLVCLCMLFDWTCGYMTDLAVLIFIGWFLLFSSLFSSSFSLYILF